MLDISVFCLEYSGVDKFEGLVIVPGAEEKLMPILQKLLKQICDNTAALKLVILFVIKLLLPVIIMCFSKEIAKHKVKEDHHMLERLLIMFPPNFNSRGDSFCFFARGRLF